MADEGATAASLLEEEGVLPLANQPPEAQNAPRGHNWGSFAQKILLAGPELCLKAQKKQEYMQHVMKMQSFEERWFRSQDLCQLSFQIILSNGTVQEPVVCI